MKFTQVIRNNMEVMMLKFSEFYPVDALTRPRVDGQFSHAWNGEYVRVSHRRGGYLQPHVGSGLNVRSLPMLTVENLPEDIRPFVIGPADLHGYIYVLTSTQFPILYVGITQGSLAKGLFGPGRLVHHIRKILASTSGQTNHTEGWREHAKARYVERKKAILNDQLAVPMTHHWSDLRMAIAQCPHPKMHEGYVLEEFKRRLFRRGQAFSVLNTGSVLNTATQIEFPRNILSVS